MDANSRQRGRRDRTLTVLNATIEAMIFLKDIADFTPLKAAVTVIKDNAFRSLDCIDLGLACADVCRVLDRGMAGRQLDELSPSEFEAIKQLTISVAEIQRRAIKMGGRHERSVLSRVINRKKDKEMVAAWRAELDRLLNIFNTELAINARVTDSEVRRNALAGQEVTDSQHHSTRASISPGESPPPPPRACFGRERLIDEIVGLAENLTPIALIGAGGIGKTSIALAVLHHDRIKGRFGDNRRFIRCDQFPASPAHFLRRLSEVIGAEVESPEDLTPLRPLLSSREMILFLDNAESILDAHGAFTGEIYPIVEELAQFETVCLCITSRISTVPRHCRRPIIPTLSAESACAIFYHIYNGGVESDIVSNLLEQLDFHALSIVSLAATALVRTWDYDRLAREWDARHTGILTVGRATIELSLASPTFCDLRPDARDILSVIAFFPQGIGENNLDWLFPTIPDRRVVFDTFDILSLTYRNNGFITMPAPFRDYLYPKDPMSSPLLRTTKERYFSRLAVHVDPGKPDFEEAQWIRLEDTNVEHLLDAFTSMDTDSVDVWDACAQFMRHLSWHKRRLVALGPKIERLPDTHPSKPRCLFELSRLLDSVGDSVQGNQLLVRTLELWRERGDELQVAQTLRFLSNVNRVLGLRKEGISQANEALEIYERFDNVSGRAQCLQQLAWLLHGEKQLDAAELAASQAIDLLTGKDEEFLVYRCYRALGNICHSKGEVGKAIDHFKAALTIGEPFNWHDEQFHTHYSLARLFLGEIRFGDAHAHVKHAKSYAVNNPYLLGCAMELQARVWYKQCKFKDAESEALLAVDVFEELGATKELKYCRAILRKVGAKTDKTVTSGGSGSNGVAQGVER